MRDKVKDILWIFGGFFVGGRWMIFGAGVDHDDDAYWIYINFY